MATLDSLKQTLRERAMAMAMAMETATAASPHQPLSNAQFSAGFDILTQGSGWTTYQDFIIPRLSEVLAPLFDSRSHISVLEVGPGPRSVLGSLPDSLRRKIRKYSAFEPNGLFVTQLEQWIGSPATTPEAEVPLPCLESAPEIHQVAFVARDTKDSNGSGAVTTTDADRGDGDEKFDAILFCHSMYGMKPKHTFIRSALDMLVERDNGLVVVFHRQSLDHDLDGLVCHRAASFPSGTVSVEANNDEALDRFAAFVAGFNVSHEATRAEWRNVCRALGGREHDAHHPDHVVFSAPEVMAAFTRHATALPELAVKVPLADRDKMVKNHEARRRRAAAIVRPTDVCHVQECVRWALEHGVGLTVLGGGHSGHCLWPNVVAVDMGAFDDVCVLAATAGGQQSDSDYCGPLILAGAGCKTGDIVGKAMAAGLTVPLGARPSVGAGVWLQGGIGHLARMYGLACDCIVGAVVVSVASGEVLCVGCVPSEHRPAGAVSLELEESYLLWAIKGAATNFGIVVSVTFKAYAAQTYSVRDWVIPLSYGLEVRHKLASFGKVAAKDLPRTCSADAYLYGNNDRLCLGVTMFDTSPTARANSEIPAPAPNPVSEMLGPHASLKTVDGVGVFECDMYMSGMHGGHGGGKTSSFKRCLFLKDIGEAPIADILVAAVERRPTALCYLHLLQGGEAIGDVAADSTAFGCRDWDFACVITGIWPRDQDGTNTALAAVCWVYEVATQLLPLSSGVYGADLGPDPRDAPLAASAFGPNIPRLARLKRRFDPRSVLAYAFPLSRPPDPKLIVLVTGESGAGKDYCADIWAAVLTQKGLLARVVSISEATKREYAAATGADLDRLLRSRAYKEQHRASLTSFFQDQVKQRPRLPEEHFLEVVHGAADADVLLITGMRDDAPSRLFDVCVEASQETRRVRRLHQDSGDHGHDSIFLTYRPDLIFHNDVTGNEAAVQEFAERRLLSFFHEDLRRLASMVQNIPGFPREDMDFRHVLGIAQQPGGLALCTSLLKSQFAGTWAEIDVVACCEAGGFVFASALAAMVDIPLALIRAAGKLPSPTFSVSKAPSHISSFASSRSDAKEERIEMERDVIPKGASVLVVDDVLATGRTLCAVLRLLGEAGVSAENVCVMVVAEFPVHRSRDLLRRDGFGGVNVQGLLQFGGA
ncbi:phosphoribosyl transferase domain protein [Lasiosphaeria ovina]|uniref:Phosphoribosyl transferase domain protein n=1 Tax=Lasiosphaeria ovina TaxID=92902 RepID=A0AAE0N492_9PEZI|nr:phosphoribosyl transferase domain protein [Lasiosphaeria ovina]